MSYSVFYFTVAHKGSISTYIRFLSLGIVLCVLSPLPLILTALINEADVLAISMTALLLCIVAVGVYMIVRVATVRASYQILLQEGDYNKQKKRKTVPSPLSVQFIGALPLPSI